MCELTKHECYVVAGLIDSALIHMIAENPDSYDMYQLRDMIHVYDKVCSESGYIGLVEEMEQQKWDFTCSHCKYWKKIKGKALGNCLIYGNGLRGETDACMEWERDDEPYRQTDVPPGAE